MNPLLAKVKLPGRVFQLPSKGVFYKKGVLADSAKDGEIEVKPMSALAEMKLRSADLLLSGKILKELCQECAPEILQPDQLVGADVDALFTYLRVVTYGGIYRVMAIHTCEKAKMTTHEVDIEAITSKPNNKILDHFETVYSVTLSNGQIVKTKPSTYSDSMKQLYMRQEMSRRELAKEPIDDKLREKMALMDIMAVIESVEDDGEVVDDREMIEEWLRAVSKPLLDELVGAVVRSTKWGYDFGVELTCKECGEKFKHELDLDPIAFFFG